MNITDKFARTIKKAKTIFISTHIHPDADGLGAQVALFHALKKLKKEVICLIDQDLPSRYQHLDPQFQIVSHAQFLNSPHYHLSEKIDLFIIVDTNSLDRIGEPIRNLVQKSKKFLFVDHHPTSAFTEALHCIDTKAAATGELVGKLIESLRLKITLPMALPLYTGILIDTSSFRYPTVTGETHRLLGKLCDAGVKPSDAYEQIYGGKKLSHMKILGKILSSAQCLEDQSVAWLTIPHQLLVRYNIPEEDTYAFINHLLILDNLQVACLFREMGQGIKISFRSSGSIDVGELARALGGGGHNHSSATIVEGQLETVVHETIKKIKSIL